MNSMMQEAEDFIAKLNPKVAKALRMAATAQTVKLPLASYGLTKNLNGGIAKGRLTMIYGNPASGKSALCMQSIAQWQKQGLVCAYVDVEGTWDNEWARRLGVDVDKLILIDRRSVSRIFNEIRPLIEAEIDVIVIDSISMATPDAFIEEDGTIKDLEKHKQIGAKAKALSALINAIHYVNESTAVIMISQQTTDFSGMFAVQKPEGGNRVMFATSYIIRLTASAAESQQLKKKITVGDKIVTIPVGRTVKAVVEKNKTGAPMKTCEYNFYYEGDYVGIDRIKEVLEEGIEFGIITTSGKWHYYGEEKWDGRAALVEHAKETPGFLEKIQQGIDGARVDG